MAPLLALEVQGAGGSAIEEQEQGVSFTGTRSSMYRLCLWSRLASRVLLPLGSGAARSSDELHATIHALPWEDLLADGTSIGVAFSGSNDAIRNTRFGAQRCKDAILDRFRDAGRAPPRVQPQAPDLSISVRLRRDQVDVALDMAGESLHRRGYRRGTGAAPLKENLAAAMLMRAGWPALAGEGAALIDPLCGSATLLIEGAFMAMDRAPALERESFGFQGWANHEPAQWEMIRSEARARAERGADGAVPEIRGYDGDPRVVRRAQENIAAAGLSRFVRVSVKELREVRKPTHRVLPRGLLITNPPYGQRLGDGEALPHLFRRLGELMHAEFDGWEAALLAPERDLARSTGLRSHRQYTLYNGRLPVLLCLFTLIDNQLQDANGGAGRAAWSEAPGIGAGVQRSAEASPPSGQQKAVQASSTEEAAMKVPTGQEAGADMFANRLRKNLRRLARWSKRSDVRCYRLYDADLPEYAVAIDVYGDWLHVAEYRAPAQVPAELAAARLDTVRAVLPQVLGLPPERIVFKRRERQRGTQQYQRRGNRREMLAVEEGAARVLVNLHDYLDTGLFLDHRPLRLRIAGEASGKRFLNLFCYTGVATVHAALGGARYSLSVDLSNTYLGWMRKNLALNGISEQRHRLLRADVVSWLGESEDVFDLILLDPPSFSNSSGSASDFDVQRDHAELIAAAMSRLSSEGALYFSNNRRRFRLDAGLGERFEVEDITRSTLDADFSRSPPIHRCWKLRHRPAARP
jgi:23S rRNA (guanine2445-N2)-methyltransferase / 23S rRNA (guanine2069-N7)-methyltransferase